MYFPRFIDSRVAIGPIGSGLERPTIINGQRIPSYRREPNQSGCEYTACMFSCPDSKLDTFGKICLRSISCYIMLGNRLAICRLLASFI